MDALKQLIDKQEQLHLYSPYNIIWSLKKEKNLAYVYNQITPWLENKPGYYIFRSEIQATPFYFLYQKLEWDSNFFNYPIYKLFTVIRPTGAYNRLSKAVSQFKNALSEIGKIYCFTDIPAEDIVLIQALTENGFRLTETRLTYFKDQLSEFNYQRFPVRPATANDIPALRQVASQNRNEFDRYHADVFFGQTNADNYLATYAEACVNGLCELVLVPEEPVPTDAFLAIKLKTPDLDIPDIKTARVLLTTVGPSCKGWHVKLVAETIQHAKKDQCNYVLMTTQATNKAVFRTSEKLGFKLGGTSHILALNL